MWWLRGCKPEVFVFSLPEHLLPWFPTTMLPAAAKSISSSRSKSESSRNLRDRPPKRRQVKFKLGWITIVINAVYLMSHITITISFMIIIETSSLSWYFVVFAISLFRAFGLGYFVTNFLVWILGFHTFSLKLFLGLNSWNIWYISHWYLLPSSFFPVVPALSRSPSNS